MDTELLQLSYNEGYQKALGLNAITFNIFIIAIFLAIVCIILFFWILWERRKSVFIYHTTDNNVKVLTKEIKSNKFVVGENTYYLDGAKKYSHFDKFFGERPLYMIKEGIAKPFSINFANMETEVSSVKLQLVGKLEILKQIANAVKGDFKMMLFYILIGVAIGGCAGALIGQKFLCGGL